MQFGKHFIELSQPQVMGILNVTPDSFSDGGKHANVKQALEHALRMIDEGATFIDVGGESTRPGAPDVSLQEELDRTIPVIEAVSKNTDCVISIDTSKADVMREAVRAGAGLINDVRALQESGALQAAAEAKVPVCLMHMQGQPRTMQDNPEYEDVVKDVGQFLLQRAQICEQAGISKDAILQAAQRGLGLVIQDYANGEIANGEAFVIRHKANARTPALNIVAALEMRKGPDTMKVITVMRKDDFKTDNFGGGQQKTYNV